jgi:hypothetical protein
MQNNFVFLVSRHEHSDFFKLIVVLEFLCFVKMSCNGEEEEVGHCREAYDEEEEEYDLEDGHNFSD